MFKIKRVGAENSTVVVKKTYPKNFTQPLVNEFDGDPYLYDYVDEDPEFVNAVLLMSGIQSTYNNVSDWEDACALYDKTIPIIYDHYGGKEETLKVIKNMDDDELGLRGWKRRPRFKKKARNLIKNGITPSRVLINPSNLDFTHINSLYDANEPIDEEIEITEKKPKGRLRRMLERAAYEEAGNVAVSNMWSSSEGSSSEDLQDIIANYYSSTTQVANARIEETVDPFEETIRAKLRELDDDGFIPDEQESGYDLDTDFTLYDKSSRSKLSMYKEIYDDLGFDAMNRKAYSKKDLRLYDEMLGQEHLTKKQQKKQQKAVKDYEKLREKRRNSQRALSKLLSSSREIDLTNGAKLSISDYEVKRK